MKLGANNNAVQLYFNTPLQKLFDGFPLQTLNSYGTNVSTRAPPNWWRISFIFDYQGINQTDEFGVTSATPDYILVKENYTSSAGWYQIKKIVLLTSSIPIRQEYYSTPEQTGQKTVYSILTDYNTFVNTTNNSPSTELSYIPPQYRWIDLIGDLPLRRIDLQLAYQTRDGEIFNINLLPSDGFNVKLLFSKQIL